MQTFLHCSFIRQLGFILKEKGYRTVLQGQSSPDYIKPLQFFLLINVVCLLFYPNLWAGVTGQSPTPWGTPYSAKPGTDFRAYFIKKILEGMVELLPCLWGWIVIVPIHTRSSWCVRQQRCWGRSEVFVSFPKSPNPLEANPPSSCALEQAAAH